MCDAEREREETDRLLRGHLTPDRPQCLVASASACVRAVVLRVTAGRGAAKSEAGRAVHLWGGRLAAATVAVAANTAEGVLRRRARQTAARKTNKQNQHKAQSKRLFS